MAETINFSYTEFDVSAEIGLLDQYIEPTIDTYRLIADAIAPILVDLQTESTIDTHRLVAEGMLGYTFEGDIDDFRVWADGVIELTSLPIGELLTRLKVNGDWKLAAPYLNIDNNWKSVIQSFVNTFGYATWESIGDETWESIGDETWGIERISWRGVTT